MLQRPTCSKVRIARYGVCQGRELRHREHRLRLLRTRHNNWAASQGSMAAPLDAPDEGRGATTAARGHPHHGIRRRSRTRRPGSGPRLTVLAPAGARSQADLNEAAGAAADPSVRGGSKDSVVTEKGDLFDNTYSADAGRTRTPQLRCNNDSVVPESGGAFPGVHQRAAR